MHNTKRYGIVASVALAAIGLTVATAPADTIAYWDFEDDLQAPGSAADLWRWTHTTPDGVFEPVGADQSGLNNHLSAWTAADWGGAEFSSNVAANNMTGSSLSWSNTGGFPGTFTDHDLKDGAAANIGTLSAWTIEASVSFDDPTGWQTFVGKDGLASTLGGTADPNQSLFYLQNMGDGSNRFRVNFTDASGAGWDVIGTTSAQPNTWYHVVATSDGSTLSLYVDGLLEGTPNDISSSANSAMAALDPVGVGAGGESYSWTVGRGMYNNGHGDRTNGNIDDVRISDAALSPSQFLQSIPEPTTLALFVLSGLIFLRRRMGQ